MVVTRVLGDPVRPLDSVRRVTERIVLVAGRDPGRLGAPAGRLGGLGTARADVTDPRSVRAEAGLLGT
ncbi:MAG: hypothetical protein JWR45_1671 [Blastococcus sp.]|nr:hypothetical protein [Blastococcus sp.]